MGKTRNRLVSRRTQAKAAAKVGRSAAKRGGPAAKVAGKVAGKAAKRGGPAAAKAAKRGGPVAGKALKAEGRRRARRGTVRSSSGSSSGTRYSKYGLFVLAGLALGVLLGRRGASDQDTGTSSSFSDTTGHHSPDEGSPAGQRGETYYSGTSLGTAGGGSAGGATESTSGEDTSEYQQPGDPNTTGSFREYSDPSAGPLIGGGSRPEMDVGTGQLEEVEQRIRSRIGEDERTHNLPRVNVEVNGDVAELRGVAPSEEVKEAFGEIAADTEGVNEVRNLLTVDPSVSE